MWSGYFYIENLALNASQKQTLVDELKTWGLSNAHPNPRRRNHWRVRNDSDAIIFEADFDESKLTAIWFRDRLAELYGVSQTSITYNTQATAYGPLVTYTYNSANRLRLGIFGGLAASYAESQAAARVFLAANAAAWQPDVPAALLARGKAKQPSV